MHLPRQIQAEYLDEPTWYYEKNTLQSDRPENSSSMLVDCISLINFISLSLSFLTQTMKGTLPSSWRSFEVTDGQAVRTAETDEGSAHAG